MITLHKFIPAWGLPDISTFCIKTETYFRMARLEYQSVVSDSRKAPKGKCPYIEHDGRIVCDSSAIVTYLEGMAARPLDAGLSPRDKAMATAFKSLFEEHLQFVYLWSIWVDPAGWSEYRPVLLSLASKLGVPALALPFVEFMTRARMRRAIWLQGTGRHAPDEIHAIGTNLLTSVSDWIQDKPYMLGNEPRTIDATAYGFLAPWVWGPWEGPIKDHVVRLGNLVPYCERMRGRFWA